VISYFGMGLPSIAFSLFIRHFDLLPTMIGFAAVRPSARSSPSRSPVAPARR
jgi:hypothetical protein